MHIKELLRRLMSRSYGSLRTGDQPDLADLQNCRYRQFCRRGVDDWDIAGADVFLRDRCAHCGRNWPA
jgi:hypothetical protein